jgi:flavorubredoxin
MQAIVVYASRYGNTEKIAYAIAAGLRRGGAVQVFESDKAPTVITEEVDLMVVGGPTEAHHLTPPVANYLGHVSGLSSQSVATFDTRLRAARWLSGSAAAGIARKLKLAGAAEITGPMSFFVAGKVPQLEPGELERAEAWGHSLAERMRASVHTVALPR